MTLKTCLWNYQMNLLFMTYIQDAQKLSLIQKNWAIMKKQRKLVLWLLNIQISEIDVYTKLVLVHWHSFFYKGLYLLVFCPKNFQKYLKIRINKSMAQGK